MSSAIEVTIAVLAILAGIALGAIVAYRRDFFRPGIAPFSSLLWTLLPLVLPLFAVAIVGLVRFPFWVTILVGAVLTLVAVVFIITPEARALERDHLVWIVGMTVGTLVVSIGLFFLRETILSSGYFESIGGASALFLVVGLSFWLLAFLMRCLAHASSWLRTLVAIALALGGLRLGAAIGLLPGGNWIADNAAGVDVALPAAIAVLLLVEATLDIVATRRERRTDAPQQARPALTAALKIRSTAVKARWVKIAAGAGTSAALLAALALGISAIVGLAQTVQPGETLEVESAAVAAEERQPGAPGRFSSDLALAKAYAPVLALTDGERWTPTTVDGFVHRAILSGPMKEPSTDAESVREKLDRTCPRLASSPCFQLWIQCPQGEEECSEQRPHESRDSERLYHEGDVYVRVVKKSVEEEEERRLESQHLGLSDRWRPKVFVDEDPYRNSLTTLIQYWYFYPYDEWEASVFAGKLVQRHESDWEAVTIGLSDGRPLFVAYSAHCAGSWKPWKAVKLSDKFPEPTHPLVAVAEGSHANYPDADQTHSPDWARCQGAPAGAALLLSYASNIRDKTEYGWQWYPSAHGFHLVDYETLPMSFPGYWGVNDSTTLVGYFKETHIGEGHAPMTPSEQPLWTSPLTKIFCGNYDGPDVSDYCRRR